MPIRPIESMLLATDIDTEAVGALGVARWLSRKLEAELHAVHVIEPISPAHEAAIPGLAEAHEQQAEEELRRFTSAHGLADAANLRVVRGEPEEEVLRLRRGLGVDLLVLGRYGQAGLRRGQIGSIAEQLVRKCSTSVLVVRPEQRGEFERIGVATDLSEAEDLGLIRALRVGAALGHERITLIHTFTVPVGYHRLTTWEDACTRITAVERERAATIIEQARGIVPNAPDVDVVIAEGSAADKVPELATTLDLLTLNVHGRSVMARLLLGRTSEKILRQVSCSVWAEKSPALQQGLLDAVGEVLG